MSSNQNNKATSGPDMLKSLDDSGLHVGPDGKIQDMFGGPKKDNGPRLATSFTNNELMKLREFCSAGCAQYGEDGLEDAGVFEQMETFIPDHSAAMLKKKWEDVKGGSRVLPDFNAPFPGLTRDIARGKAVAAVDDGAEKEQEEKETE